MEPTIFEPRLKFKPRRKFFKFILGRTAYLYKLLISGFNVEFYDVDDERHYYYNTMDTDIKSTAMRLLDISSQPFPVPINSVENLEVIFDSSKECFNIFKSSF